MAQDTAPDSSLAPMDKRFIGGAGDSGIVMEIDTGVFRKQVNFQFPPKITGENNASNWDPHDIWSTKPLDIHRGSKGREITLEWEYVASDSNFNCLKVAETLRVIKTYFYRFKRDYFPIVRLTYGMVIPKPAMFQLMDLNIAYSREIIFNKGIHPLHTTCVAKLNLAHTMTNPETGLAVNDEAKVTTAPLQTVIPEWY